MQSPNVFYLCTITAYITLVFYGCQSNLSMVNKVVNTEKARIRNSKKKNASLSGVGQNSITNSYERHGSKLHLCL